MKYIDVRSDTVTQPTQEMRQAMFLAEVGDDVYQDDPTTNRLEDLAAQLLGKEAALFVTSGTMGNQLGLMSHTRRGDEAIVSDACHIFSHEVGAAAVLSGINLRQLHFEQGVYDAALIETAIRPEDIHEPPTSLICVENALANGRIVPLRVMKEVWEVAQAHGLAVHLDGARIFNAAVALGVDVKEITRYCDTVSCCLSKGLCAPVGSVLAGPKEVIARARKYRKMLGGGMRQNGFLAAAGILALTEMTKRLQQDHDNAKYLATLLHKLDGVEVDLDSVQINMVFCLIRRSTAVLEQLQPWMLERGIKIGGYDGKEGQRFVTNHDVSRSDIEQIVQALAEFLAAHPE